MRRRRRWLVAGTLVLGGALLGRSMSTRPGSREFYAETLTVAGVWTAGGLLSGPLHLGWIEGQDDQLRRPLLTPLATGTAAFGLFYLAARVSRRITVLDRAVGRVLLFADEGSAGLVLLTTLANGLAEEVFFRGALYSASTRYPVATSTAAYAAVTANTRNPALVLAAGGMGALFGLQRRATGGLQASALTHLTWSTLMVRFLPPLFRRAHGRRGQSNPEPARGGCHGEAEAGDTRHQLTCSQDEVAARLRRDERHGPNFPRGPPVATPAYPPSLGVDVRATSFRLGKTRREGKTSVPASHMTDAGNQSAPNPTRDALANLADEGWNHQWVVRGR